MQTATAVLVALAIFGFTEARDKTTCETARDAAHGSGMMGQFVPKCKDDGSYEAKQCHERQCVCVDADGKPIGQWTTGELHCYCPRATDDLKRKHIVGEVALKCQENGLFEEIQCDRFGSCFCYNVETGVRGMRPVLIRTVPTCFGGHQNAPDALMVMSKCEAERQAAIGKYGSYMPRCNPDGTYEEKQCHERQCTCVDADGQALGKWTTDEVHCNCPRAADDLKRKHIVGEMALKCQENGLFEQIQCDRLWNCFCYDVETGTQGLRPIYIRTVPTCLGGK